MITLALHMKVFRMYYQLNESAPFLTFITDPSSYLKSSVRLELKSGNATKSRTDATITWNDHDLTVNVVIQSTNLPYNPLSL